jgi:hypothetical protein
MSNKVQLTTRALAFGLGALCIATSTASAFSDRVNQSCKNDYYSFCSQHPVGSTTLRRCMESNGRSLSQRCVNALVDAGEIPRKYRR